MAKRIRKRDLIIEFLQLITGIGVKKGKKAAPRFELGIKDLQSSALPLGHAAMRKRDWVFSDSDRISHATQSLLVICNGHGEDQIALRILEALHQLRPELALEVLPLVGDGQAFLKAISEGWLKQIGPSAYLPSGGFGNQSLKGLLADLSSGLLLITWQHWRCVRRAVKKGQTILAVGDILPLLLAWSSGGIYGFIGTPKSDFTWLSGPGRSFSDFYHRLKGTEWDIWECALMSSSRCRIVAVRDRLTARGLRRHGVRALAPGNPMMDGLQFSKLPTPLKQWRRLILLCGSRVPEAVNNFQRLLDAIESLETQDSLAIFVALGSSPPVKDIEALLQSREYRPCLSPIESLADTATWQKGNKLFLLGPGQFFRWAFWAEVGLANAGTATEQLVGLGIPALSLPGEGPQFKHAFAFRQSRLLGGAVMPCGSVKLMASRLDLLLRDELLRKRMGSMGIRRMGKPGGSMVLASLVSRDLCCEKT